MLDFMMSHPFLQRRSLALACLTVLAPLSFAQSNWIDGKETVVVGQLLREPLSDVIPSMSVLTQKDIQSAPARDVFELINGLPGVEATRSGPVGSPISVSMRGASSAQTLVLIDGMPINSQSAIGAISPLESIPLPLIQRIEILRGNATAQYGPGAVGGVINITTAGDLSEWANDSKRAQASATMGRFGEQQFSAGFSSRMGDNALSLSAGQSQNKGFNAMVPTSYDDRYYNITYRSNPAPNGYANDYYALNWTRRISEHTEAGVRLMHSKLKSDFDNMYALDTDVWENKSTLDLMSAYVKHKVNSDWVTRWQYSDSQNKQSTYTNGAFNPSYGSFDTQFRNLNWDNTYAWSDRQALSFGAATSHIRLNANHLGYLADFSTVPVTLQPTLNTSRMYLGLSSHVARFNSQLTLSRDELGQGVGANNFLLGGGYALGHGYKLTATRSSALLAPSVGQRYDASYGGNPALMPERSYSNEAGLQYQADRLNWRFIAFKVDYQNLISSGTSYVSDPFWRSQYVRQLENIGQSRNGGYEWAANWRQARWWLGLNMTWQNPENLATTLKPINKARRFGSVRAGYDIDGQTRLTWMTFMTSDRYTISPSPDDSAATPSRTSGYALHHLTLERQWGQSVSGKFTLLNVFDRPYNVISGYAGQPRTWMLTVTYWTR